MIDVNDFNPVFPNPVSRVAVKKLYPMNEDVNVIPFVDLLLHYNRITLSNFVADLNEGNQSVKERWLEHLELAFGKNKMMFDFENNVKFFISCSLAEANMNTPGRMDYNHLRRSFSCTNARSSFLQKFRTPQRNIIVVLPGMVYEVNRESGKAKVLFCIVVKKEWIVDVLFRRSLPLLVEPDIRLNPSSFGLLYDSMFDHKDYPYKGLRSYFRKHIKPVFEEEDIALEHENITDLFKKKVKLPSFLVEKEKEDWCTSVVQEMYDNITG